MEAIRLYDPARAATRAPGGSRPPHRILGPTRGTTRDGAVHDMARRMRAVGAARDDSAEDGYWALEQRAGLPTTGEHDGHEVEINAFLALTQSALLCARRAAGTYPTRGSPGLGWTPRCSSILSWSRRCWINRRQPCARIGSRMGRSFRLSCVQTHRPLTSALYDPTLISAKGRRRAGVLL